MNWRKAHRNKQRALARKTINLPPRWFTRSPDIAAYETWKDWMDKLMSTMLNSRLENCLAARLMSAKRLEPLTRRTRLPLPPLRGMPYYVEPDRRTSGAYQGQSRFIMIVDDVDFSKPCEPRPRKRFIYGDNWNAYQVIEK